MVVKVKWSYPSEGQLPSERMKCYIIDGFGEHRIMTYHPQGGCGGLNWEGESGSQYSWKSNLEIRKWTTLLDG